MSSLDSELSLFGTLSIFFSLSLSLSLLCSLFLTLPTLLADITTTQKPQSIGSSANMYYERIANRFFWVRGVQTERQNCSFPQQFPSTCLEVCASTSFCPRSVVRISLCASLPHSAHVMWLDIWKRERRLVFVCHVHRLVVCPIQFRVAYPSPPPFIFRKLGPCLPVEPILRVPVRVSNRIESFQKNGQAGSDPLHVGPAGNHSCEFPWSVGVCNDAPRACDMCMVSCMSVLVLSCCPGYVADTTSGLSVGNTLLGHKRVLRWLLVFASRGRFPERGAH